MFQTFKAQKRLVAIWSLFSLFINMFQPAFLALALAPSVYAQDSSLSLSFNSATHTLNLGSSFAYNLYYQTGEQIEAVTGTSSSVYLGSASTEGTNPHNLVRGILKNPDQTVYFVKTGNSIVTVASATSSVPGLSTAEESWLNDPSTYGDLKTGVTYYAPFNQDVSVTFTTLPENPGTITFNHITLTPDQVKESGAISSDAYEITSTMADGTFTYSLTLPNPSMKTDVGVEYSEDGASFVPTQNISAQSSKITIPSLNHFTIFVVTNVRPTDLATTIVDVTADSSKWFFYNDETDVIDNTLGSFVAGPGTAPLGDGSVQISVTGSQRRNLATYQFSGTPLADITTLGFSTYNPSAGNPGDIYKTAYLNFNVDFNLSDTWQRRLIFTPPSASVTQNTWKDWDAIDSGNALWHYSGTTWPVASSGPHSGISGISGSTSRTWSDILADYPGVRVRVSDSWLGIRVGSPYPDGYTENIDNFQFGTISNGLTKFNFDPTPAVPACSGSSSFDSASLGSVNGQGGWSIAGSFDQAVVDNNYGYPSFGCKSLRISDGVTSGSFGDQLFAPPTVNGAGETAATSGSFALGTRQNYFETQFDLASIRSTQQPGMHISISPDRGDGSRMSYLRVEDGTTGLDVYFDDVQGTSNPANFVETQIATGLDRNTPHTFKFNMDFVEGPSNDVIKVWIDGALVHTGTSWENYYRYDSEASAEQSPRIVKTVLFRESGAATAANSGKGFLIDNFADSSSIVAPNVPTMLSPVDGAHVKSTNLILDWTDSSSLNLPVTYTYQSSYSSAIGINNGFTSPIYNASTGTNSQIDASGSADNLYYWQVKACDSTGNCSDWSDPWAITVDNIPPTIDLVFPTPGSSATSFKAVFSENVVQSEAENPANFFLNNWPGAGGSGNLVGDVTIVYNPFTFTSTMTFINPGWYISPEQQWRVENIHDLAGNLQAVSPYSEYSTPMVDPTDPGTPVSTPNPTNSLSQSWSWTTSTDIGGSGVKGYWQNLYNVLTSTSGSWSWLGNVLGSTTSLSDGEWQLQLKAEDNAGNQSADISSSTITIDTTAPTKPAFTAPINNLYTNANFVTLTWNGGDDSGTTQTGIKGYTIRYTFVPMGGGAIVNWSSGLRVLGNPKTHSGSYGHGQGTYTMYLSTTDYADNVSLESEPLVLHYDATAPAKPIITSPTAEQYFKTSPILNQWGVITDPSGINLYRVEYIYSDGHLFSGAPYRTTTTNSRNHSPSIAEQGGVTIRVRAEDNSGNNSDWSDPIHYIYDSIAPTLSSKTTFSGWYNSPQESIFTYTDNKSPIISGTPVTCDLTSEGTNQTCQATEVNVCDAAGNCNTTSQTSNSANLDFTDPISTITSPSNSGTGSTIYTNGWDGSIAGTSSDATSGVDSVALSISRVSDGLYWDGANWVAGSESTTRVTATGTDPWTYNLSDPAENSYTITSHAIDGAGNVENSYVLTIIFDKTIPEVAISLNPATPDASNGWYKTQPEVTLTATDDIYLDKIEYQWDSQTVTWTAYSAPFKPGSEGAHVLYYRAHDLANNYSEIGVKNIKWDKTELTNGPLNVRVSPNPTSGATSVVTWEAASDNVGIDHYDVQWRLGDLVYTDSVGSDIRTHEINRLIEGNWSVTVRAYDAAGNNKEASSSLTVDRTAPAAPTLTLTGTATGTANLSWNTVSGANSYIIWYGTTPGNYIFGANVGNVTSYSVQGLGAGNYYFIVRAHDSAGNGSGNSNEVSTGTIVGAPGVAPGAPAAGFTEEPAILGEQTEMPELVNATDDSGSVLGTSVAKGWYWWLLLLLVVAYFIYRKFRKSRS